MEDVIEVEDMMKMEDVMEVRRLGIRSQVDSHRSISWSQHHYACIVGPL